MPPIPGSVRVAGFIAPTDSTDTYAVTDEAYDRGGYRSVADATARLAITPDRRKVGMAVYQIDTGAYWTLLGGISNSNWVLSTFGSGSLDVVYHVGRTINADIGAIEVILDNPSGAMTGIDLKTQPITVTGYFVGVNIQPTVSHSSPAYLLSSDGDGMTGAGEWDGVWIRPPSAKASGDVYGVQQFWWPTGVLTVGSIRSFYCELAPQGNKLTAVSVFGFEHKLDMSGALATSTLSNVYSIASVTTALSTYVTNSLYTFYAQVGGTIGAGKTWYGFYLNVNALNYASTGGPKYYCQYITATTGIYNGLFEGRFLKFDDVNATNNQGQFYLDEVYVDHRVPSAPDWYMDYHSVTFHNGVTGGNYGGDFYVLKWGGNGQVTQVTYSLSTPRSPEVGGTVTNRYMMMYLNLTEMAYITTPASGDFPTQFPRCIGLGEAAYLDGTMNPSFFGYYQTWSASVQTTTSRWAGLWFWFRSTQVNNLFYGARIDLPATVGATGNITGFEVDADIAASIPAGAIYRAGLIDLSLLSFNVGTTVARGLEIAMPAVYNGPEIGARITGGGQTVDICSKGYAAQMTGNVEVNGTSNWLRGPRLTNVQQAAMIAAFGVGDAGKQWFNTDLNQFVGWNGTGVVVLG